MWGEEKDNGDPWITTAPPDPPVELLRRYQLKVNNPDAERYGLQKYLLEQTEWFMLTGNGSIQAASGKIPK